MKTLYQRVAFEGKELKEMFIYLDLRFDMLSLSREEVLGHIKGGADAKDFEVYVR